MQPATYILNERGKKDTVAAALSRTNCALIAYRSRLASASTRFQCTQWLKSAWRTVVTHHRSVQNRGGFNELAGMILENPASPASSLRQAKADFGRVYLASGLVAFIFAVSGPVAVILAVGTRGGLSESDLSSWIFGAFFLNGLVSIAFSWRYRQPLVILWTIPGAVLVGPGLGHLPFSAIIGAYIVTGLAMLVLGASGLVRRWMEAIPLPIVMAMVAGVFLRFGLDLVLAVRDDFWIAAPMVAAFLTTSAFPRLARRLPPLIGALLVGIVMIAVLSRFPVTAMDLPALARPNLYLPTFSWEAMLELVIPLAITVLAAQNGQGIAVLKAAGHEPPINAITLACGATSMATALVGCVPTCLTGPVNAILVSSGDRARHYIGALVVGVLVLGFGLLSPLFTRLMLATPRAFIAALAGLAMLRVLQSAFTVAFKERFTLGALVALIVTLADVPILTVGAPFWGLVFGFALSWLLESGDFRRRG
jgi:benzoate membrane transport protein